MITVKATREMLIGDKTATGYRIDTYVPFVALPSTAALRQWVRLYNPATKKGCRALVLDIGPWNEKDHAYVFQPLTTQRYGMGTGEVIGEGDTRLVIPSRMPSAIEIRPLAESGIDSRGRKTNKAGIDLGEAVWASLGMTDNADVMWEFD